MKFRMHLAVGVAGAWLLFCPEVAAQGQLIAAGYAAPAPMEVAPGQIVTLFFRDIGRSANGRDRIATAGSIPLPETLAGLSVAMQQLPDPEFRRIPLLAVRQQNECEDASGRPECLLTAIRVQIPTNLTPTIAKLRVETDGVSSRTFLMRPVRDDAHVLTVCDGVWDTNPATDCLRIAFHPDGRRVDEGHPAVRGGSIVLYAFGLGPTNPPVVTGTAAAEGAEVIDSVKRQLSVRFSVFRNASGGLPRYWETEPVGVMSVPAYVGLTPGQVGLYQINVRIPESLEIPLGCGDGTRSNVLVKVTTARGTENVPVCVAP